MNLPDASSLGLRTAARLSAPRQPGHGVGVALMLLSAVAFSTAGFFTRLVTLDAPTLLFWRGIFSGLTIAAFVLWRERCGPLAMARAMGWPGLLLTIVGSAAMITFVSSLRMSSVAEVSVIYATVPLGTAALGSLLLHERAGPVMVAACLATLAGMAVMMSGAEARGHLLGDLVAAIMTAISALFMVVLRWRRSTPTGPAVAAAAFSTALAVLPWASPLAASPVEIAWAGLFGIVQNGMGLILMVVGSRYVTAAETALYGALESPLAPLWVWLVFAETPTVPTVLGGGIVLAAVLVYLALTGRAAPRISRVR